MSAARARLKSKPPLVLAEGEKNLTLVMKGLRVRRHCTAELLLSLDGEGNVERIKLHRSTGDFELDCAAVVRVFENVRFKWPRPLPEMPPGGWPRERDSEVAAYFQDAERVFLWPLQFVP